MKGFEDLRLFRYQALVKGLSRRDKWTQCWSEAEVQALLDQDPLLVNATFPEHTSTILLLVCMSWPVDTAVGMARLLLRAKADPNAVRIQLFVWWRRKYRLPRELIRLCLVTWPPDPEAWHAFHTCHQRDSNSEKPLWWKRLKGK